MFQRGQCFDNAWRERTIGGSEVNLKILDTIVANLAC
jgi:hypothetical protein